MSILAVVQLEVHPIQSLVKVFQCKHMFSYKRNQNKGKGQLKGNDKMLQTQPQKVQLAVSNKHL